MVVGEPKRSIMEGIENTGDVRLHDHRLRLKQRFDIIRKLGQGTYGKVQLGINKKTGQEVAIKTIKKCKIETEADLVRIRREVQIMSSVRHPNIVHIYEVFENSEKMILVMEYCAGGELYDYLSQQKVLQEDEARRLFRQIATAVYYCHKHKICHRDLKLENVLLDEHGSAKIADFGLSNVFEERRLLSTFCGSPLYASPEIVKGTPYIGPEVDCWSLGVLLYTLVYGAMPFDGSNFKRLVKQISTGDYFEPKSPSSASPLIREMLTVDPIQRADIPHICDHPWVNKGSDVSCLELAEILANETPVRLDLLLSLAPPPSIGGDKLVVTDEVSQICADGSPARSMSVANIDNSAERRILEMVAEGGTDAIKPSPTRTIINNEQPKRKLETTMSMDNAPSQRKKERIIRSSSGSKQNIIPDDSEVSIMPFTDNDADLLSNDISMGSQIDMNSENLTSELTIPSQKKEPVVSAVQLKSSSPTVTKNLSQLTLEIPNEPTPVMPKQLPEKTVTTAPINKESKPEPKSKETTPKPEKIIAPKPVVIKKKTVSPVKKDDKAKVEAIKEKSPPRKSIEKDIAGRVIVNDKKVEKKDDVLNHEISPTNDIAQAKQPERRKSRILDAAEKLNNLSIQPTQPVPETAPTSPPIVKPKKVLIPGVSVGSFKEQFERRASLTSGNIPVPSIDSRKPTSKTAIGIQNNVVSKPSAIKKMNSVDSEHPHIITNSQNKEPTNIKLETIGIEPVKQIKEEPMKPVLETKKPAIVEVHKVPKILHKSESMRESTKPEPLTNINNMSLEDARRSLQQSMALLTQAKSESRPEISEDFQNERQKQLKTAREIISNAIGDDGKKVQRICMGGKPPVPYGSGGRSSSGTISLHSLNSLPGSPPTSPPHPKLVIRESPARTFRTEVQHRVDDVRNKYLPNSRGGSVERIIPIHFADEAPKPNLSNTPTSQLAYQRTNSTPFRLGSLSRNVSECESERISQPHTPSIINNPKSEPIKKSPREFIIPIAVEGKGYVTPRQGSVEPNEPTKMTPSNIGFASRFPKPRRISSLVSGGESEDEDDMHMHRLRSSRRVRADPEKDSVSSGEEDDDEGFELLTAENLFSTLLDRVRSLTNRLNGEEGTGFPQHHQSLFNNLHSPFFNSPHLPRKHKRHNVIVHKIKSERSSSETREGPSWRRSTSRDVTSDFDSMFPNHPTFPRGSRKSRKATSVNKSNHKSAQSQTTNDVEMSNSNQQKSLEDESYDSLDLSDLDLSKIELSEKDMETLSGLTPALSRRLQKQLLEHLPPAAARTLRRTLSMNYPNITNSKSSQHKYTRSSSASKTASSQNSFTEESYEKTTESNVDNNSNIKSDQQNRTENIFSDNRNKYRYSSLDDDDSSSVSTLSRHDRENSNTKIIPPKYTYNSSLEHNASDNSMDYLNDRMDAHSRGNSTPRNLQSTPDKSVLRKYFSDDRSFPNENTSTSPYRKKSDSGNICSDSNYLYGHISPTFNTDTEGLLRRRSLRTSAESSPRRRISRFLRPDFFDTPREESIYVRDKVDKETETQKVLKEIREKKNRSGAVSPNPYANESSYLDMNNFNFNSKNCMSPVSPLTPNRSRSVTPFYPILDNISEIQNTYINDTDLNLVSNKTNREFGKDESINIQKELSEPVKIYLEQYEKNQVDSNIEQEFNKSINLNENIQDSINNNNIGIVMDVPNVSANDDGKNNNILAVQNEKGFKPCNNKNSKITRPKSYPVTTSSPEKKTTDIPATETISKTKVKDASPPTIQNDTKSDKKYEPDIGDGNITVSFNISLPSKATKANKTIEQPSADGIVVEPKKVPTKKKIIVKKSKSSGQKLTNVQKEEAAKEKVVPPVVGNGDSIEKIISKENDSKAPITKKKSVFQSIGQKFEKLRSESFSKSHSQEKDADSVKISKPPLNESAKSISIDARVIREHSVPVVIESEPTTESGLIKRAVTITNLPVLDSSDSQNRRSVSRVLGLFKKIESKDKNSKLQLSNSEIAKEEQIESIVSPNENGKPVMKNGQSTDCKPKRPTSLLLNGIGKRVQACYGGATSDSALSRKDKKPISDSTNIEKVEENKCQKKGLRLDFSKLPKLNQNIFNKKSSSDLPKNIENKDVNSRLGSEERSIDIPNKSDSSTEVPTDLSPNNDLTNDISLCSNSNLTSPQIDWSPDYDANAYMKTNPKPDLSATENMNHSQLESENMSPESENIIDRIRRKSFYSRFNEKKNRRKSLLVGPGAKEYIPSARINPQCDNEDFQYHNKYDLSPTSPTKYNPPSYDLNRHSHLLDKSDCLSSLSPKIRMNDPFHSYSYSNSDKVDQKYSDTTYLGGTDSIQNSIPRYQRTLSYFDESRSTALEPRTSSTRYGRTLSLLSPGIYATYSPRSQTRNSAILLRDSLDTDVTSEDILAKIRNRKKAAALNTSENSTLDSKIRSNHSHNGEHDMSTNKME